jgi:hypothetical protein
MSSLFTWRWQATALENTKPHRGGAFGGHDGTRTRDLYHVKVAL